MWSLRIGMIYPENFEDKIEFSEVRRQLRGRCMSQLGGDLVDKMAFSCDLATIRRNMDCTTEFMRIVEEGNFPDGAFVDVRATLWRVRIEHTYVEVLELFDLQRSLRTVDQIVDFLRRAAEEGAGFPVLLASSERVSPSTELLHRIDKLLDENGHVMDSASPQLRAIRNEQRQLKQRTSRLLGTILQNAQNEGLIDSHIQPAMRDGRLVIPVAPAMRRKIRGIVHDVSDSGKTFFIEPNEVVEANNRSSELEVEERKEIVRILKEITDFMRPHIPEMLENYRFLALIDFTRAKALYARATHSVCPQLEDHAVVDWSLARHPILLLNFLRKGKEEKNVVPLDIALSAPERRILLISGPNAGGKSVCLKTVGLLQYMLQCGMPVPMAESSRCGVFQSMFIDIGDEQDMESDLSTYSSHLRNMKAMLQKADDRSLLLIDELGGGTEPQIGGAIAQAVLQQLNGQGCFGVVTTHYQNLKHMAQDTAGLVNGAMLYDRQLMRPLFRLSIGSPGSSFAIDIAHKTGIPREVIRQAEALVGSDYIQSDRYVQDILRDKRYWQDKREVVHKQERQLEEAIAALEDQKAELRAKRQQLMDEARQQAREILNSANAMIERTVKEIKEAQAEKEETKRLRAEMEKFRKNLDKMGADTPAAETRAKQRQGKKDRAKAAAPAQAGATAGGSLPVPALRAAAAPLAVGDYVKIKGQQNVGRILKLGSSREALVAFGDIKTNVKLSKLTRSEAPPREKRAATFLTRETRDNIRETKLNFRSEITVIGMRADEALQAVAYFIDDAVVASGQHLRIVHGTGTGILKTQIRRYLSAQPCVSEFHDELPQYGGAGVTVVELA